MATDEINETPETALPADNGKRRKGAPSAKYHEQIAAILALEEENKALRVITIISDDKNAPEYQRLTYSYPAVIGGENGYIDSKGNTVTL